MENNWTTHRARIASLTRSRSADDPELLAAYAALYEARHERLMASLLKQATDKLSVAQRKELAKQLVASTRKIQ